MALIEQVFEQQEVCCPFRRPERPTLTAEELLRLAGAMPERYRALVLVAGTVGLRWGKPLDSGSVTSTSCVDCSACARLSRRSAATSGSSGARGPKRARRAFALPAFLVDELAAHLTEHRSGVEPADLVFLGPRGGSSAAASRQGSSDPQRRPSVFRAASRSTACATWRRR